MPESPWTLLTLLLAAPVLEELVFRSGLQESLLRGLERHAAAATPRWRPLHANLLTAVAFAAAHALHRGPLLALATLPFALMLGALYQRQRRVLPCVLLHAAFNGAWLLLAATPLPGLIGLG